MSCGRRSAPLNELRAAIGAERVSTDPAELIVYAYDGAWAEGRPAVVLHPETTRHVAESLRIADRERIPVVPRGAATGLAGGAVAVEGGWCLNLARMNKILDISAADSVAVVQPGVVTAALQKEVEKRGLFYPPDPASLHMCTIGGNVSTNAGGPRCLKYGVTADYVLALEVVLPGGRVMRTGRRTIKDVAGYNLTQLLVGSEGTLGAITEITLQLIPKPAAEATALAAFPRIADACEAVGRMLASGIVPLVTELMDRIVVRAVDAYYQSRSASAGLPLDGDAVLLVAVDGDGEQVERDIDTITALLHGSGASEVRRARDAVEAEALWEARRAVSPALIRLAHDRLGEDIVVPRGHIPRMVERLRRIAAEHDLTVALFGHIGDGNLHPTILCDRRDGEMMKRVQAASGAIFDVTIDLGGSITGEHGVGIVKLDYLRRAIDPIALEAMQAIKRIFDPNGVMNPGKKLPSGVGEW
ncbi:MAG TPA: FAD-linked oxidase C-terminal domain-containing protein [Anaerolineae bacterium]|nr:FAD-linked oxidase C-terminal domain-containing protein [Anaerolineae bacterium]